MIYIAGPFFNEQQKADLQEMISCVREVYPKESLFIPMEHEVPGGSDKDEHGNYTMPNQIWGREVFNIDLDGLYHCDKMFACYTGMYSDTGTAWEIGFAYGMGIPVYLFIPEHSKSEIGSCMVINGSSNYKLITNEQK